MINRKKIGDNLEFLAEKCSLDNYLNLNESLPTAWGLKEYFLKVCTHDSGLPEKCDFLAETDVRSIFSVKFFSVQKCIFALFSRVLSSFISQQRKGTIQKTLFKTSVEFNRAKLSQFRKPIDTLRQI